MRLLAGSLNVQVDEFLHAGYLSAYPRSFARMEGGHRLAHAKAKVINVDEALELKPAEPRPDGPRPATQAEVATGASSFPPGSMASDAFTAAVLFFFFAFLVSLYYRRIRRVEKPGWRPWLLASGPLLLFLVIAYSAFPKYQEHALNSLPPPWQGVPVQEYENPQAATEAIVQTLIVPALAGCSVEVKTLPAIQNEVAFPVPTQEHTPGMAYALKTYGRDGWGKEFRFDPLTEGRYRIASAGADGTHGTADDIVVTTAKESSSWERLVNGVYVRRVQGDFAFFVHRVEDGLFRGQNMGEAQSLTGTDLFDMFGFDELLGPWIRPEDAPPPVMVELAKHQESRRSDVGTEPLFFVQILSAEDG